MLDRVPQDRSERRDARTTGNEQDVLVAESGGEPETSERSLDVDNSTGRQLLQVRIRAIGVVDLHEEFKGVRVGGLSR
jgi:hypothetical protein